MRIDKFLKVTRLVKRRESAKDLCLDGDVLVNGRQCKPMSEVANGDKVVLKLGKHTLTIDVIEVRSFANKEQAEAMYRIVSDEVEA